MISHEEYENALNGKWGVLLASTKYVQHEWIEGLKNKKILSLASGGGQQFPVVSALGTKCTVLDLSKKQCESKCWLKAEKDMMLK